MAIALGLSKIQGNLESLYTATSHKAGGVVRVLRLTLAVGGSWSAYFVSLRWWLARSLCGNVEWTLRPRTTPPAFWGRVGVAKTYDSFNSPLRSSLTVLKRNLPNQLPGRRIGYPFIGLNSRLPQSGPACKPINERLFANQKRLSATDGQGTDARFASPAHPQA